MWHSQGHQSSLPDGGARAWRRGRAAREAPGPSQTQVAPHSLLCRFYSGHHLGCLQGQNLPWWWGGAHHAETGVWVFHSADGGCRDF